MIPPTPPHPPKANTPPPDDGDRDYEMPPPRDELDGLLREWHTVHADRARAGRDRLLAALSRENDPPAPAAPDMARSPVIRIIRRTIVNRYSPVAAAALVALALAVSFLVPGGTPSTLAQERSNVVMAPDGGRLDAFTPGGEPLGPCELARTDVNVEVAGFLTRVTLRQTYHNPHADKIEAVYTFPLGHRAAVDRMRMIIGDRVIDGEVRERDLARQMYESARDRGRTASLLEQERPNIFTQSVANIEPGARIEVEIGYVELLEPSEGTYSFTFPTVVGPRYIPGSPAATEKAATSLPDWLAPRRGIVLLAPGTVTITATGDDGPPAALTPGRLGQLLAAAIPCHARGQGGKAPPRHPPRLWHEFTVAYPDGSSEPGVLDADGTGHIGGRAFWIDPEAAKATDGATGEGFASNTTQVPDASRITPMPVRPEARAGHTIGISVTIDGGGAPVQNLEVPLHAVETTPLADSKVRVDLTNREEIPNRDFVLSWRLAGNEVRESVFTHTGEHGNFFSLILQPPARVEPDLAVPRELIFVLDTSGSMSGFPIDKAKEVMSKSIDAMRGRDTFNLITFSGDTRILWDRPRPNTPENRAEAQRFLAGRSGGGGTEMMKAIEAALAVRPADGGIVADAGLTLEQLANLPADGREVTVEIPWDFRPAPDGRTEVRPGTSIRVGEIPSPTNFIGCPVGEPRLVTGVWETVDAERHFRPTAAAWKNGRPAHNALRIVTFMTDGYVGNDMAIIDAIRRHRGTTRVFSFGVGNSVNRYLLDNMARAGGGEAEYILLESDADKAVGRLTRRISTPVLANIGLHFSEGLQVVDVIPAPEAGGGGLPDLFDERPIVIHGRYTAPGSGTLTITGLTGRGPYERTINLDLPANQPKHSVIATLWAREKIETIMNRDLAAAQRDEFPEDLRKQVVTLGETFGLMSQFTSFIAIDKLRITIDGQPRLVAIPIEMPDRVSYEGVFGESKADSETHLGFAGQKVMLGKEVMRYQTRGVSPAAPALPPITSQGGEAAAAVESAAVPEEQRRRVSDQFERVRSGARRDEDGGRELDRAQPAAGAGAPAAAPDSAPAAKGEPATEPADAAEPADSRWQELGGRDAPATPEDGAARVVERLQRAATGEPDPILTALDERIRETKKFIEAVPARPTEHPDIVALRRSIADLQRERDQRAAVLANPALALLDPALIPLVTAPAERTAGRGGSERTELDAAEMAGSSTERTPLGRPDGTLLLTILVTAADEPTLQAIKDLGATVIHHSAAMNVVIVTLKPERLADLAKVPGVRRVEPTRHQPARAAEARS